MTAPESPAAECAELPTHYEYCNEKRWKERCNCELESRLRTAAESIIAQKDAEIERLTMQAAACMTATFQNTRESIKDRIGRDNLYWTQGYADGCASVDREIEWRERAQSSEHNFGIEHSAKDQAERRAAELAAALKEQRTQMDYPYLPPAFAATMKRMIDAALGKVKP